jgi:hypothetical protein
MGMAKNERGQDVPAAVEAEATRLKCHKHVKYVYRDGDYPSNGPATSIDCVKHSSRLTSGNFDSLKVQLGGGHVAFRSRSSLATALVASPQPEGELPPLPGSRIGKITRTKKIDGSPLVFRVEDDDLFTAPSNAKKAYLLQKVRIDDGEGFDEGHDEYRIAYYMIGHKKRVSGKWAFGQFAPIMTPEDLVAIVKRMKEKGWLKEGELRTLTS